MPLLKWLVNRFTERGRKLKPLGCIIQFKQEIDDILQSKDIGTIADIASLDEDGFTLTWS